MFLTCTTVKLPGRATDPSPSLGSLPRIVLLSEYPPDHASFTGGVQTAAAALLEGLEPHQSEFEFHVISLSTALDADVHEQRGGFVFHFLSLPRWAWLPSRAPFRIVKVLRELRRIRPALVHCNGTSFACLAVIAGGFRRVLTIHGVGRHEAHLRTGRVAGHAAFEVLLERYVLGHFSAFICISRYAEKLVAHRGIRFAIPNPVASVFVRTSRLAGTAELPVLVFIGVVAPLKRPVDLLLAHARLRREIPTLETLFCGHVEDVAYARHLKQLVRERGIQGVRFLEHASREQIAEILRKAAVLVVPSAQENAPMIVAEAMTVGLPVVATRIGGVPDMVDEGETGFLYEPGDVAALTAHVRRLLGNPLLRRRFGHAARQRALETYSARVVGDAVVAVYRSLSSIQQHQSARARAGG